MKEDRIGELEEQKKERKHTEKNMNRAPGMF